MSTGQIMHAFQFQCARCNTSLSEMRGQSLTCGVCHAVYPSIADIRIFVSNANELLDTLPRLLSERRIEIENQMGMVLADSGEISSAETISRIESAYGGQLANLDMIEEQILPIRQYLDRERPAKAFYGEFVQPRMQILDLLPYFYRDWHGTEEFRFITHLFTGWIHEHCKDKRESIAVLGAGACGLVYEVADFFDKAFGVDLSIEALLMANGLLNGGEMRLHFNFPGIYSVISQEKVTLRGPTNKRSGIQLIAADVNRLPFSSQSLSCVITQYLFETVPDQKAVAREIHRVLSPGGVWINFGWPLASFMADLSTTLDLPRFLERVGFELLETSTHRYNLLDLSAISSWATTITYSSAFFAGRKNVSVDYESCDPFAEYFAGKSERVWTIIPKLRTDISVGHERRFSPLGVTEGQTLSIEKKRIPERISVSAPAAGLAQWVLQKLTESRTIRNITDDFREFVGQEVPEAEIVEFLSKLYEWHFIDID